MSLNDFFSSALSMAQSGNWAGFIALVLSALTIIFGSIGGVSGVIAIIYKMFSNKKFLYAIKTIFEPIINQIKELSSEINDKIQELRDENKNIKISTTKINSQINELRNREEAFYLTVLNTDELKNSFDNYLQQVESSKKIKKSIPIESDIVDTAIAEVLQEDTSKKTKTIKLKDGENK